MPFITSLLIWICFWKLYTVQALEQIEKQLQELHREEIESKEVELKVAQERRRAIEDMEKGVWSLTRSYCLF